MWALRGRVEKSSVGGGVSFEKRRVLGIVGCLWYSNGLAQFKVWALAGC